MVPIAPSITRILCLSISSIFIDSLIYDVLPESPVVGFTYLFRCWRMGFSTTPLLKGIGC
jgi:hypothetical protein